MPDSWRDYLTLLVLLLNTILTWLGQRSSSANGEALRRMNDGSARR